MFYILKDYNQYDQNQVDIGARVQTKTLQAW